MDILPANYFPNLTVARVPIQAGKQSIKLCNPRNAFSSHNQGGTIKSIKPYHAKDNTSLEKNFESEKKGMRHKFESSRRVLLSSIPLSLAGIISSSAGSLQAGPEYVLPDTKDRFLTTGSIPSLPNGSTVELSILSDCGLGVSFYPDFVYNAVGGGGIGAASDIHEDRIHVDFDTQTLRIPSVEFKTTTLLGVPLPPPLRIDIIPESLKGYIWRKTGQAEINFQASFFFSAGPLYKAPPLLVDTVLTTEFTKGETRCAQGSRLDSEGRCKLVGTARVPPVGDLFMDNFLMLPTDVLAVLPAQFVFRPSEALSSDPGEEEVSLAL